jgi:hypothetical protein
MKRSILLTAAAFVAASLSGPAYTQITPQTVTLMKVDPSSLATGYRSSKIVGSSVVNDTNETVGTVDDIIITPTGQAPYVIISVGGFLGIGTKYVALPFTALRIVNQKATLPGGTKDALTSLPDFKYNTNG